MLETETLSDLLCPGLQVVFVGVNPAPASVQAGHYYSTPGNIFWSAFSASRLSQAARAALSRGTLLPSDDVRLQAHGFGFTDIIKHPTSSVAPLTDADWMAAIPGFLDRIKGIESPAPRVICMMAKSKKSGYPKFRHLAWGFPRTAASLGFQQERIGSSRIFVTHNPSRRNAQYLDELVQCFDQLADWLQANAM